MYVHIHLHVHANHKFSHVSALPSNENQQMQTCKYTHTMEESPKSTNNIATQRTYV